MINLLFKTGVKEDSSCHVRGAFQLEKSAKRWAESGSADSSSFDKSSPGVLLGKEFHYACVTYKMAFDAEDSVTSSGYTVPLRFLTPKRRISEIKERLLTLVPYIYCSSPSETLIFLIVHG